MVKKIKFAGFWKNSEPAETNFFLPLFEQVFQEEVQKSSKKDESVDLEISSVFDSHNRFISRVNKHFKSLGVNYRESSSSQINSNQRVWFTGESIRPPIHQNFDAYLSYDRDDFFPNNLYLPLWVLNLSWFGRKPAHGYISTQQSIVELMETRNFSSDSLRQKKFCCVFINNPENLRMSVLKQLESLGEVDIFGKVSGTYIEDKAKVANNYRFMMCFENKLYPGYVSEKLLEAYQSKTFPLYWGDDSEHYFNEKAYLNLKNFDKVSNFIKEISHLNTDLDLLSSKISEPLLLRPFDMQHLITQLRLLLKVGL